MEIVFRFVVVLCLNTFEFDPGVLSIGSGHFSSYFDISHTLGSANHLIKTINNG